MSATPNCERPPRRGRLGRVAALSASLLTACAASAGYQAGPEYSEAYAAEPGAPMAESVALAEEGGGGFFDGVFGGGESDGRRGRALSRGRVVAQAAPAGSEKPAAPDVEAPEPSAATTQAKRLMIYKASYLVMVASVDTAIDKLLAVVEERGGYLAGRQDGTLTVRIPAARFFEVLDLLPDYGRVVRQNLEALDVTKQVADLQLRIGNARAARDRLVKLLEQAVKMEDILKIEVELRRLTDEIEGMEAQLKGLADQIAFSTLAVTFQPNAPDPTPYHGRRYSRFDWINQIGVEAVANGF